MNLKRNHILVGKWSIILSHTLRLHNTAGKKNCVQAGIFNLEIDESKSGINVEKFSSLSCCLPS